MSQAVSADLMGSSNLTAKQYQVCQYQDLGHASCSTPLCCVCITFYQKSNKTVGAENGFSLCCRPQSHVNSKLHGAMLHQRTAPASIPKVLEHYI